MKSFTKHVIPLFLFCLGIAGQGQAFGATFYCVASCRNALDGAFLSTNGVEYTVSDCTGGLGYQQSALIYSQSDSMQGAVDSLQTQCDSLGTDLANQKSGETYDVDQEGDYFRLDDNGNGYLAGHEDGVFCTAGYSNQSSADLFSGSGGALSPINDCKITP